MNLILIDNDLTDFDDRLNCSICNQTPDAIFTLNPDPRTATPDAYRCAAHLPYAMRTAIRFLISIDFECDPTYTAINLTPTFLDAIMTLTNRSFDDLTDSDYDALDAILTAHT